MSIKISSFGKVKAIENFSRNGFAGTEVKIYAKTGEKKKDGEEYAPGQNFKVTLTEAQVAALSKQGIELESIVFFSGNLTVPYTFKADRGDTVVIQQLNYGSIEKIHPEKNTTNETVPTTSKAKEVDISELPF
jgi:hypothetical protein